MCHKTSSVFWAVLQIFRSRVRSSYTLFLRGFFLCFSSFYYFLAFYSSRSIESFLFFFSSLAPIKSNAGGFRLKSQGRINAHRPPIWTIGHELIVQFSDSATTVLYTPSHGKFLSRQSRLVGGRHERNSSMNIIYRVDLIFFRCLHSFFSSFSFEKRRSKRRLTVILRGREGQSWKFIITARYSKEEIEFQIIDTIIVWDSCGPQDFSKSKESVIVRE